jgi:hypothetical protein
MTDEPKITLEDFYACLQQHAYIYAPTRAMWPGASIDSLFPSSKKSPPAHVWLDRNRGVEQLTYAPGYPMLIEGWYYLDGGWIKHPAGKCFNLYRPPEILRGVDLNAMPLDLAEWLASNWIRFVKFVYPGEAREIILYCAHCVQRPWIKINHFILLGGVPGIGKDEILAPVRQAIGPWNFTEATAEQVMGAFTEYQKGVAIRINEARDLGDVDGYKFYNRLKWISAAPPETRKINEKHLRPYYAPNVGGVFVTSNHRTGSIFPEPGCRRTFATWSERQPTDFVAGFFDQLGHWYEHGSVYVHPNGDSYKLPTGFECVATYLNKLDLSSFNPYAPPRKTAAFYDLLSAGVTPETGPLGDLLDALGRPGAVTLDQVKSKAGRSVLDGGRPGELQYSDLSTWLNERKNWNAIPHQFDRCGYTRVNNDRAKDGYWKIGGRRQAIYARKDLDLASRIKEAEALAEALAGAPFQSEAMSAPQPQTRGK